MDSKVIYQRMCEVFTRQLEDFKQKDFSENLELYSGGLFLTSIEAIGLFLSLEEEFKVEFPLDSYIEMKTVKDIIQKVNMLLS